MSRLAWIGGGGVGSSSREGWAAVEESGWQQWERGVGNSGREGWATVGERVGSSGREGGQQVGKLSLINVPYGTYQNTSTSLWFDIPVYNP